MAFYDEKPSVLEAVGNGSYIYRFNIEEQTSHEQKLVNEFNAANLGMVGGSKTSDEAKERIAAYKEFLECRKTLKEQVDADCVELGIK